MARQETAPVPQCRYISHLLSGLHFKARLYNSSFATPLLYMVWPFILRIFFSSFVHFPNLASSPMFNMIFYTEFIQEHKILMLIPCKFIFFKILIIPKAFHHFFIQRTLFTFWNVKQAPKLLLVGHLAHDSFMPRIMICLQFSKEIRSTSVPCTIFMLLTFFFYWFPVPGSCFIGSIFPTNCKMSAQFTKYRILSITGFYSIKCLTLANVKSAELARKKVIQYKMRLLLMPRVSPKWDRLRQLSLFATADKNWSWLSIALMFYLMSDFHSLSIFIPQS